MEKVRAFDRLLKQQDYYHFLFGRLFSVFLAGCAVLLTIVNAADGYCGRDWNALRGIWMLLGGVGACVWLGGYMVVADDGDRVSIYDRLRYAPVSNREILAVRCGYLNRFCGYFAAVNVFVSLLTALAKRQWTVRYLLFPLAVGCAAWVVGFLELYIAYLKYEKKGWSHRA